MTSPIGNDGAIILAAAKIAGVNRIFRVGGAQAIAAMAFGTGTIPKVDKIVGPGNIFVATAKRLVFGEVNIDSIAGPSEILLLVDDSADPEYVAADMLSQAEHDELAAAVRDWIHGDGTEDSTGHRRAAAPDQTASHYLQISGKIWRDHRGAWNGGGAPACQYHRPGACRADCEAAREMGAGSATPERYFSVPIPRRLWAIISPDPIMLPTGGSARFFSPLGTYDFLKRTTIIQAEEKALRALATKITQLARLEGLDDHARAVEARFK